jgi:hypothetical protein
MVARVAGSSKGRGWTPTFESEESAVGAVSGRLAVGVATVNVGDATTVTGVAVTGGDMAMVTVPPGPDPVEKPGVVP